MSTRPPLFVHLVFHPESDSTRKLAMEIHHALNGDSALPWLRVPVVFACEDGSCFPPLNHELDEAARSVVVVLADDKMVIEPSIILPGRQLWSNFIGNLSEQCEQTSCRFIPVQLSENAWPLDERLSGMSFLKAHLQSEDSRSDWVVRTLVVEICRFLQGEEPGERMPLRLFLSHAKQDIAADPQVFNAIVAHLQATQPVETWVDSAKIEGGSQFAEEIERGVGDSALLSIVTRNYNSRQWCRTEMLLAKRKQRPIVVVDAHEGVEIRSFPYGGNTPRIRWTEGGAEAAVDLLLKETLRHCLSRLLLERQKLPDDIILPSPPEPTTVARAPKGATILYPDPPIGDEEEEELEELGRKLETPLQRAAEGKALTSQKIILSSSESGDTLRHGLTSYHQDAALIEISRQLLARGAILEYGGHLGAEGYTTALFEMARSYNALSGVPAGERILNDVGWPLPLDTLPVAVRAKHQRVAIFRRIPRPAGVEHLDAIYFVEEPAFFPADKPERRYAWARGMTAMRQFQAEESGAVARIIVGGKVGPTVTATPDGGTSEKWYMGRIPGVVEEALLSLRAKQPIFLVGAFGGAAEAIIDLLEGRDRHDFTWTFQKAAPHAEVMRALYGSEGQPWEDYNEMTTYFKNMGVEGLAKMNRLTVEENRELFASRDVTRMVELILEGLARL